MSSLSTVWTKHLKGQDKEQFESVLRNSKQALSRLVNILDEKTEALSNAETRPEDFSDPNWPYKQAFRNGQKAGLREIRELLKFIKDNR